MNQFSLNFQPGLTEQYKTFRQVLAAAVYGARCGLNGVAAACDVSPSLLSRYLNENADDPRNLPADLVPVIIETTQDYRAVYWLIEKFVADDDSVKRQAVLQLRELLPKLEEALNNA